jgi:multicomponent Na+:H+ antiporter subunit F
MIALATCAALGVSIALVLARLFAGPTLYDRMLAALSLIGKAALICAALSVLLGAPQFADAALALAFASLILAASGMKFFQTRTFQAPVGRGARS